MIFYFESRFTIDDQLRNKYELWLYSIPRKSIKSPKKWQPILNEVGWDNQHILKFIFCLESAYILIVALILIKAGEEQNVPKFQLNTLIEDYFNHYHVENEVSPINWGIICNKMIGNMMRNNGKLFEDFVQYSWWQSELIETTDSSLESISFSNFNHSLIEFCRELANILFILTKTDLSELPQDVFGDLYQNYFDRETRKTLGEFYTPIEIVEYILDYINYQENNNFILTERLIDPSCGSGSFLTEAIKRYLKVASQNDNKIDEFYWSKTLKNLFSNYKIVGYDVNPFAIILAKMNFLLVMFPYLREALLEDKDFKIEYIPIFNNNILRDYSQEHSSHEPNSLIEIRTNEEAKFDYVVGNPPYINIRTINKEDKSYYKKTYHTAKGLFDIYCLFIEKGVNLLRKEGKLGYITSNQFLLSDYGKFLRDFLIHKSHCVFKHILDFRDSQIFESVTNYPCILVLEKKSNVMKVNQNQIKVVRVSKPTENLLSEIRSELNYSEYFKSHYDIFDYPQSHLSDDIWILMPKREKEVFEHILKMKDFLLGEIAENIFVGTQTSLDEIYLIFVEEEIEKKIARIRNGISSEEIFEVEKQILKKILKGKDIRRWTVNWSHHWLIFPYYPTKKTSPISRKDLQNSYPKAWQYFLKHKKQIIKREGGIMKNRTEWYAYIYPKNHDKFEQTKLIGPLLSRENKFALDIEGNFYFVAVGGNCITLREEYKNLTNYKLILALLNSSLLNFYLKHISPVHNGGYYLFINQFLKRLPIILTQLGANQRNEILKIVDKIFEVKRKMESQPKRNFKLLNDKILTLESSINRIIFEIYNLEPNEIQVIQEFNNRY